MAHHYSILRIFLIQNYVRDTVSLSCGGRNAMQGIQFPCFNYVLPCFALVGWEYYNLAYNLV